MRSSESHYSALKEQLQIHLSHIVRERDPYLATAGHFYVQQYVRQQLAQWGQVEAHEFKSQGSLHQNLILNLPGKQPNLAPILIGAHYDAMPGSPGADDNATGVAVLLELARSFYLTPTKHPIRLVAFDFEETIYGQAGSTHYAHSLQQEPLRLMLSLEMLGYCSRITGSQVYPPGLQYFFPKQGDFIALIGNLPAMPDLIRLSHTIRQNSVPCEWLPAGWKGKILPDTRRSDHAVFWDLGYRAMMVTDTAHLRNPHYHQASDRIETLDLDFLTGICQGLVKGLSNL
jgi:Zn-dependent M28 family amino/carboxypeptidase